MAFPSPLLFFSARAKLTFWYVMVLLAINLTISGLFFFRTNQVLMSEFIRIEERIAVQSLQRPGSQGADQLRLNLLRNNLQQTRQQIFKQLVIINAFIALLAGISSYWLAGQTLEPIAEAMDEQKRFIGDAAHELKTPLTALRSNIEVQLLDKKMSKKTQGILTEFLIDVENLQNLTTSLLQLAKVEHSSPPTDTVDLAKLAQQAIDHLEGLAAKKNITLKLELSPKAKSVCTIGDAISLYELLIIFLDNAIKYSPNETEVLLRLESGTAHVRVHITDQGIGIAKHHLPHIFDRFYRVDAARTQSSESAATSYGLGLSVAKKIIDWHNANIKVTSSLNKGTTFTITMAKTRPPRNVSHS